MAYDRESKHIAHIPDKFENMSYVGMVGIYTKNRDGETGSIFLFTDLAKELRDYLNSLDLPE